MTWPSIGETSSSSEPTGRIGEKTIEQNTIENRDRDRDTIETEDRKQGIGPHPNPTSEFLLFGCLPAITLE